MNSPLPKKSITFEVVYAHSTAQQWLRAHQTNAPCTVEEAIALSGIQTVFPEIDLSTTHHVGIFGRLVSLQHPLEDNDRIEIYRPLMQDPKVLRHKRANVDRRGVSRK